MIFSSIEQVIKFTGINAKAAEVLGKSGALCNLEDNLNEVESAQYAKEMVAYFRERKGYQEKEERRREAIRTKNQTFREKVETRRLKMEERQKSYQRKLTEWQNEVSRREEINATKEREGKKLLKIPEKPNPPKSLAEVSPPKEPKFPVSPQKPAIPRETLSQRERIKLQREMLHMYLSGHPLDEVSEDKTVTNISSLKEAIEKPITKVRGKKTRNIKTVRGVLLSYKVINLRSKQLMARLRIEDKTGSIEVVAFPQAYKVIQGLLEEGQILKIIGEVDQTKSINHEGNEQVHAQLKGMKFSTVRIGSDKDWDIKYPLFKGTLRILPTPTQQSKGKAVSIIMQHARE
jgi:DNA polymerase III alpha subunit